MDVKLSNGVRLHYEVSGAGPNLILLHGNGQDHHDFDALVPILKEHFTVYGVDSRGQGQSSHQGELVYYEEMASDIDLFIRELGLEDVSIMGHSDGAIIATLLGIEQMDYLSHLILLSVTLDPENIKDETKEILQWLVAESDGDPMTELMLTEPNIPLEDLSKIQVPTLVACGDNDVMSIENYNKIKETIPLAQLYVIPGANHIDFVLGSQRIAPEVIRFLEQSAEDIQAQNDGGIFGQNKAE